MISMSSATIIAVLGATVSAIIFYLIGKEEGFHDGYFESIIDMYLFSLENQTSWEEYCRDQIHPLFEEEDEEE